MDSIYIVVYCLRSYVVSCLHKCNKLNKSHLVGQLLNSIHVARTQVYKIINTG